MSDPVIYESEELLPDDYPVHWDYVYLCDGVPRRSHLGGGATVLYLKRDWKCKEIRKCDLAKRNLL